MALKSEHVRNVIQWQLTAFFFKKITKNQRLHSFELHKFPLYVSQFGHFYYLTTSLSPLPLAKSWSSAKPSQDF